MAKKSKPTHVLLQITAKGGSFKITPFNSDNLDEMLELDLDFDDLYDDNDEDDITEELVFDYIVDVVKEEMTDYYYLMTVEDYLRASKEETVVFEYKMA